MKYVKTYKHFQSDLPQLNENFAVGLAVDAVQFMIGAAAEYGIAAGSIGYGTPVACMVETIIDAAFAGQAVKAAVDVVSEIKGQMDKFVEIYNKAIEAFETFKTGNFEDFYNKVRDVIKQGLKTLEKLGVDAESSIDKLAERLKKMISDLIRKITDAVGKGVKMLIPDATASVIASTAIKGVVEVASDNGYTIATKAIDQLGDFKKYVIDPNELPKLLDETFPKLYTLIEGFKKKIEEMGYIKAVRSFGAFGLTLKQLGPKGLDKLSSEIKGAEPGIKQLVKQILEVVLPTTFCLLAIVQIILKGEYKADEKEEEQEFNQSIKDLETKNPEGYSKLGMIAMLYEDPVKNKEKIVEIEKQLIGPK